MKRISFRSLFDRKPKTPGPPSPVPGTDVPQPSGDGGDERAVPGDSAGPAGPDRSVALWVVPFAWNQSSGVLERSASGSGPHAVLVGAAEPMSISALVGAALRGYHVYNPARELVGLAAWPYVEEVATDVGAMVLMMERVSVEVGRCQRLEAGEAPVATPPVVLVIGDVELLGGPWGGHPTVRQYQALARLAREAGLFLLVAVEADFQTRVGCVVLEVADVNAWAALATWAEMVEEAGYAPLAGDVRRMLAEVGR